MGSYGFRRHSVLFACSLGCGHPAVGEHGAPVRLFASVLHFSCPAASCCLGDASIYFGRSSRALYLFDWDWLQKQAGWSPHAMLYLLRAWNTDLCLTPFLSLIALEA